MEEQVGQLWHKLVTRLADDRYIESEVRLNDIKSSLSVFYRALGGDGGLQIISAEHQSLNLRRQWMQRIAGSGQRHNLSSQDHQSLRLPSSLGIFPDKPLNRDLYFWLAAMAAVEQRLKKYRHYPALARNQINVLWTLHDFPGLTGQYARLVAAHLEQRPDPASLPATERSNEVAIRQALTEPGSSKNLQSARHPPQPVPLWLYSAQVDEATNISDSNDDDSTQAGAQNSHEIEDIDQRKAERVDEPQHNRGLITLRMENIFTWDEFAQLDRASDDEDDIDKAEAVARESEKLAISRNHQTRAVRLKFDLDLPASEQDDAILSEGLLLPEWNWKTQRLVNNHCRVIEYLSKHADACELPAHLIETAKKLKKQFQMLAPARCWHYKQTDGEEFDLDAYLRYASERTAGVAVSNDHLYQKLNPGSRDLASLLIADLSLSTDSFVNNQQRVIDVIRDSLLLFAESLQATGDPFSMIGFSSRRRDPIRVHILKRFEETYSPSIRGRIAQIKPGFYTRMGAAIRYGTESLSQQGNSRKLLLILTDGKPNDLDQYEGRYGIEDTREAILAARKLGLQPFCVTIDRRANQYLPHLFGHNGYIVVNDPLKLPNYLPRLYLQLTQ